MSGFYFQSAGCSFCNYTGYYGRTVVHEILEVNDAFREALINDINMENIMKTCLSSGFVPFEENCRQIVINGKTTYEEYLKILF